VRYVAMGLKRAFQSGGTGDYKDQDRRQICRIYPIEQSSEKYPVE